jgi:hypothetical protein
LSSVKIINVRVLMHKLEILWRSRIKLVRYSIVEIGIINVTWFKFGMPMQNKIMKKL